MIPVKEGKPQSLRAIILEEFTGRALDKLPTLKKYHKISNRLKNSKEKAEDIIEQNRDPVSIELQNHLDNEITRMKNSSGLKTCSSFLNQLNDAVKTKMTEVVEAAK